MSWYKRETALWRQVDKSIDLWLNNRQQLLVLLYRLLKVHPFVDEHLETDHDSLQTFCQNLIDYVSAGHFEIFEKIAEASEYSDNSGLDRDLLVSILRTTVTAMDFSSKYEKVVDTQDLKQDLSKLGEALARRMDLEDELIQTYVRATSELAEVKRLRKTG